MAASKATLHSILFVFCITVFVVHARILKLNSSDIDDELLISDGVDHQRHDGISQSTLECYQQHDGSSKSTAALRAATCDHQYNFLPCAENIPGYFFLIVVYQFLLIWLDGQIETGSKELFNIIGETKVGGFIFRFLMALPSMIFLSLSAVFSSKENAQSKVSVGVGIFAGITVFSLTFQWGIILILGCRKLKLKSDDDQAKDSTSSCLPGREQLIKLKDNGVMVHGWTRKTGGIMLLSLIPYAIVQLANIFRSSSANRVITIVALIVSVLSLASYFLYQITSTWMQETSLAYVKHDIQKERILEHIQQGGQFLTNRGEVDTDAIRNVFAKADMDRSKCLTKDEVEKMVRDLNTNGNDEIELVVEMIMTKFDKDNDGLISEKEFVDGCINWLKDIQKLSEHIESSLGNLAESRKKKKRHEDPVEIHRSRVAGQFLSEDGKIDTDSTHKVFVKADTNQDECITKEEVRKLVLDFIKSGKMQVEEDFAVKGIMTKFDLDNRGSITEKEFVDGCKNWLSDIQKLSQSESSLVNLAKLMKQKKRDEDPAEIRGIMSTILKQAKNLELKSESLITKDRKPESLITQYRKPNVEDIKSLFKQLDSHGNKSISKSELQELVSNMKFGDIHRKPEEIVDIIFEKLNVNRDGTIDESEFVDGILKLVIEKQLPYDGWILVTSLMRVILGALVMTLLGGPLMNNILFLSYAMGLPSFCTSFVIVPITMSLGTLLTSIVSAKKKGKTSASLAFSQIYSSVVMNNILGLTSLLFIVYFKGLTWDFSAEVLTILTVCAIIGVMAYKWDSYPLWTCIVAILLYPASLGFYYLAQLFWGWN